MRADRIPVSRSALTLLIALFMAGSAIAQTSTGAASLASIRIDNFGRINDQYYRGAQPDGRDYDDLAALGVRTVVDLTRDGRSDEEAQVEHAGMKFYRIPLTTSDQPAASAVTEFLDIVNDPANQPVYVHCQGGRHRTGVMTAVYRMTEDSWSADRAYDEMKRFHFEGFPSHPTLKNFVYSYCAQMKPTAAANQPAAAKSAVK
jgi:tyrosine-protein phosphatase SIW14